MFEFVFKPFEKWRTADEGLGAHALPIKSIPRLGKLLPRLRGRLKKGNVIFPMFGIR